MNLSHWSRIQLIGLIGIFFSLFISLSHALPLHASQLQARDLDWEDLLKKGQDWQRAMQAKENEAEGFMKGNTPVTSPFTEYTSLKRWGWVQSKSDKKAGILDPVLKDLNIDSSNNQLISWEQADDVENDQGQLVTASSGEYNDFFNTVDRVLVADMNISPQELAGDCGDLMPDLRAWSDVMFLQWQELYKTAGKSLEAPKYIIQMGIANDSTKEIVRRILGKDADFSDWSVIKDGKSFKIDTVNYWALLASPLGRGAAWFLTQHKPQLGLNTVSEITVRGTEGKLGWALNMMQKIEAV